MAMQCLEVIYTRRFNNRHARSGHLFQGRFKSLIVENDAYLVRLSCYIHRNPLVTFKSVYMVTNQWIGNIQKCLHADALIVMILMSK